MVLTDVVGTNRSPDAANQRWQRPGSLATSTQSSDTYVRRFDVLQMSDASIGCILDCAAKFESNSP